MCTWECGPVWEHARRWRVGNPAGCAAGRLGVHCSSSYPSSYIPGPDFIYANFSGGRGLDFIYTSVRGFCREKALIFSRKLRKMSYELKKFPSCPRPYLKEYIRKTSYILMNFSALRVRGLFEQLRNILWERC